MSATAQILEKLTSLEQRQKATDDQIRTLSARRDTGAVPTAAPWGRKGEDIMSSRGFSFAKLIRGYGSNSALDREHSKIELDFADRLCKQMERCGWRPDRGNSVLAPLWPDGFDESSLPSEMWQEMKSLIYMGVAGADPGEVEWLSRKYYGQKTAATPASPAMSWVDASVGGAFVGPATFGPPIELLRNNSALLDAGATVMPLGPTGRVVMPRLTAATQGGWSGENTGQTPTTPKTGSLELSAKKVIGVVVFPNELLRFASPAAELLVRNDLFKTVALIADKGGLEGPGSSTQPLGLATMAFDNVTNGVSSYGCPNITPTNSNQLSGQNVYDFFSAIEENNGEATRWIMRPKMAYAFYQSRWTPYSGGTSQGGFLFELTRGMNGKMQPNLGGVPITRSVQVSNTRGSGAQTYVLALNIESVIAGMFGAIEFTQTDAGWNLLASDQTAVRAVLSCDFGMRYPSLLAGCDALNFTIAG